MNKHLIVLGIAILLICVGLSGCNEQNSADESSNLDSRFFGTWYNESSPTLKTTFFSNGTYKISPTPAGGAWETKDGKLIYSISLGLGDPETIMESRYSFSNNDTVLTLTDITTGKFEVYIKQ